MHPRPRRRLARDDPQAGRRRHGRGPAQHEPRRPRRAPAPLRHGARQASDASGHGVGIIADLQGPKIRLETFAEGKVKLTKGAEFVITTRDVEATPPSAVRRTRGCPATCPRATRSWSTTASCGCVVVQGGRHRRDHPGRGRRARSATTRASTCPASRSASRPCRRRTRTTCAGRCGPRVDFIALSFVRSGGRRRRRTRDHARGGRDAADHRQDREAAGDRQPRRDHRGLRRVHGGPRRPRRGVPARGRAVPAEAGHRQGPPQRQAGDRGHPDARVDDHQPAARRAPRPPTSRTPCSTAPTP